MRLVSNWFPQHCKKINTSCILRNLGTIVQSNNNNKSNKWGSGIRVSNLCKEGKFNEALSEFNINPDPMGASSLISLMLRQQSVAGTNGGLRKVFSIYDTLKNTRYPPDDIVSFTLVNACRHFGDPVQALSILKEIKEIGVLITEKLISCALGSCSSNASLSIGEQLYSFSTENRVPFTTKLANSLMAMYLRCGAPEKSLGVGDRMLTTGMDLDSYTYSTLFTACSDLKELSKGQGLYLHMLNSNIVRNIVLHNALMSMYAQCGCVEPLFEEWDRIGHYGLRPTSVSFAIVLKITKDRKRLLELCNEIEKQNIPLDPQLIGAVFAAYIQCELPSEALSFWKSLQTHIRPTIKLYSKILAACENPSTLEVGSYICDEITRTGVQPDARLITSIITMYTKCKQPKQALHEWKLAQKKGFVADEYMCSAALSACADCKNLKVGEEICQTIQQLHIPRSHFLETAIVNMYIECRHPELGLEEWKWVQSGVVVPDHSLYCHVLLACAEAKNLEHVNLIFDRLHKEVVPLNVSLYLLVALIETSQENKATTVWGNLLSFMKLDHTSLADVLAKCAKHSCLDAGYFLVQQLSSLKSLQRDVTLETTIILILAKCGKLQLALQELENMRNLNIWPNKYTYCTLFSALADFAAYNAGVVLHHQFHGSGIEMDAILGTSLVTMFAKCGDLKQAEQIFTVAEQQCYLDTGMWNAIIAAYGIHGKGLEALLTFQRMQQKGYQPNDITFIALLNACSHAGMVEDALNIFRSMQSDFGITPTLQHQTCLVDALGRKGRLTEAEKFIEVEVRNPDIILWMTLLGACRSHKDVKRTEEISKKALALDPHNASVYVLLANTYASVGQYQQQQETRAAMKQRKIKKVPGRSSVELNGIVHTFVANERNHKDAFKVHAFVKQMYRDIQAAGYQPQTEWVLHDMEEGDNKEDMLCQHSEKLAIGFAIMNSPQSEPIRVTKNLRVCGDCHSSTKFLSAYYHRTIIVRDASRFHHFQDGKCTCGDFW